MVKTSTSQKLKVMHLNIYLNLLVISTPSLFISSNNSLLFLYWKIWSGLLIQLSSFFLTNLLFRRRICSVQSDIVRSRGCLLPNCWNQNTVWSFEILNNFFCLTWFSCYFENKSIPKKREKVKVSLRSWFTSSMTLLIFRENFIDYYCLKLNSSSLLLSPSTIDNQFSRQN